MGSLITPTAVFIKYPSHTDATVLRKRVSGAWVDASIIYKRQGSTWVARYSTPSLTTGSLNQIFDGSGASGAGRTYSPAGVFGFGYAGTTSGHYHYEVAHWGGDVNIGIENPGDPNTRFYRDFSGVPNGSNSGYVVATFRIRMVDDDTGAIWEEYLNVSLRWINTIPAFSGRTDSFSSGQGGSITVPNGAASLKMVIAGPGGGGAGGQSSGGNGYQGNGGGGALLIWQTSIGSSDWGQTINYGVGNTGGGGGVNGVGGNASDSTVSGWINVTAGGGKGGQGYSGGAGGTASGPGTAYNGNPGFDAVYGSSGGFGGNSYPDTYTAGNGGGSGYKSAGGSNGGAGYIFFIWGGS